MRPVGEFNNLSKETKEKIKPLLRGYKVSYRLINHVDDLVSGQKRFGAATTIPTRDSINDNGRVVDIGVPRIVENGVVKKVKKFRVSAVGENLIHNGVFELSGSNAEHVEFYEYFEVCNYNKSNPDRDESVLPIFERIDDDKEADVRSAEIDALTKALILVSQMSNAEIRDFARVRNWNLKESISVLKSRVKTFAKDEPETFVAMVDDPENKTKIVIKQALDAGIIIYQPAEHKMLWADGNTIAKLDRAEVGEDPALDCFYRWTREKSNGENILKSIKLQLSKLQKAE